MFQLTEPELKALAFLFDIEVLEQTIMPHENLMKLKMDDRGVFIRAGLHGPITMGLYHIERKKMSDGTSWGGTVSFASMMKVYRGWYQKGTYEFTLNSDKHTEIYGEHTADILLYANEQIVIAQ